MEMVSPDFCGEEPNMCTTGSKLISMHSSASWNWHQKATVAMAKTAASKVSERFRLFHKAIRWANVTGGLLGQEVEGGAIADKPWMALFRWAVPCHGAPFTMCHSCNPSSHVHKVPPLTKPVPHVVMKMDSNHSGQGMCRDSGMSNLSQD